jgi:hypothetical protein
METNKNKETSYGRILEYICSEGKAYGIFGK